VSVWWFVIRFVDLGGKVGVVCGRGSLFVRERLLFVGQTSSSQWLIGWVRGFCRTFFFAGFQFSYFGGGNTGVVSTSRVLQGFTWAGGGSFQFVGVFLF